MSNWHQWREKRKIDHTVGEEQIKYHPQFKKKIKKRKEQKNAAKVKYKNEDPSLIFKSKHINDAKTKYGTAYLVGQSNITLPYFSIQQILHLNPNSET